MPLVIKEILHPTDTHNAQSTLVHNVHEIAQSV